MAAIMELLENILKYIVEICTIGLEFAGIVVLVSTAFICFVKWLRRDRDNVRLDLAQGIALALEFKMGGEVLRTVVVREKEELIILGAIILLRGALTFLIHWEIENEKKEMQEAARARAIAHGISHAREAKEKQKESEENSAEENIPAEMEEEYYEVEASYEENFRRPSLGHADASQNTRQKKDKKKQKIQKARNKDA